MNGILMLWWDWLSLGLQTGYGLRVHFYFIRTQLYKFLFKGIEKMADFNTHS